MKKFLSLGILVAALAATVGCDDKKTTAGPVVKSGSTPAGGMSTPAAGAGSTSK